MCERDLAQKGEGIASSFLIGSAASQTVVNFLSRQRIGVNCSPNRTVILVILTTISPTASSPSVTISFFRRAKYFAIGPDCRGPEFAVARAIPFLFVRQPCCPSEIPDFLAPRRRYVVTQKLDCGPWRGELQEFE